MARAGEAELLVNLSGHLRWRRAAPGPSARVRRSRSRLHPDLACPGARHRVGGPRPLLQRRRERGDAPLPATHGRDPLAADPSAGGAGALAGRRGRRVLALHDRRQLAGPVRAVELGRPTYGLKVHEFRRFLGVPGLWAPVRAGARDRSGGLGGPRAARRAGLAARRPPDRRGLPRAFHRFVRTSGAEFSVAQGVYVDTRSGWFSDRTVRYLASGRPALVQDTGFSEHIPVGEGSSPSATWRRR